MGISLSRAQEVDDKPLTIGLNAHIKLLEQPQSCSTIWLGETDEESREEVTGLASLQAVPPHFYPLPIGEQRLEDKEAGGSGRRIDKGPATPA